MFANAAQGCSEQLILRCSWFGKPCNEERVKILLEALEPKMDGYERILSKQKYLAGDVSASNVNPNPRSPPRSAYRLSPSQTCSTFPWASSSPMQAKPIFLSRRNAQMWQGGGRRLALDRRGSR
jgi:hypothetical protein